MSDPALLGAARAAAGRMFMDTCTIERAGTKSTDPLTGIVTTPMVPLYSGPCRVQQGAAPWAGPATVAQAAIGLGALVLQLPVAGTTGITKDDVVTITACRHDPDLVGRVFSVQGESHESEASSRKIPLLEVVS